MKKMSNAAAQRFKRPLNMHGQKSKSYFSERNRNCKKVKKNIYHANHETLRCNQQLNSVTKYRGNALSSSLTKNVCTKCNKSFQSEIRLKKHFCSKGNKHLECTICKKCFRQQSNLKMHYRVHLQKESYLSHKSAKTFEKESHLNRHFVSYSLRIRKLSSISLNGTKRSGHLKKTFSKTTKDKILISSTPRKVMKHNVQLVNYIDNHEKEKPFSCSKCEMSFNRKDGLKKHFIIHSDDRPFPCRFCKKVFKRKDHLRRHFGKHLSDKPFSCYKCMKTFKQKNHLKLHNRKHSQDSTFACKNCEKTFKRKYHLKRHSLIHSHKLASAKNKHGNAFECKTDIERPLDTNAADQLIALKARTKVPERRHGRRNNSGDTIVKSLPTEIASVKNKHGNAFECKTDIERPLDTNVEDQLIDLKARTKVLKGRHRMRNNSGDTVVTLLPIELASAIIKHGNEIECKTDIEKPLDTNAEDELFALKARTKVPERRHGMRNNSDDTVVKSLPSELASAKIKHGNECKTDIEKPLDTNAEDQLIDLKARTKVLKRRHRMRNNSGDTLVKSLPSELASAKIKHGNEFECKTDIEWPLDIIVEDQLIDIIARTKVLKIRHRMRNNSGDTVVESLPSELASAKNKHGNVFECKTDTEKPLDTNAGDGLFALKARTKVLERRNETRTNSGDTVVESLSSENCDKSFNCTYELTSPTSTYSESSTYKCCVPDTTEKSKYNLTRQVCADLSENSFSTDASSKAVSTDQELDIHINIGKEVTAQDFCDIVKHYQNVNDVNHLGINNSSDHRVVCSYCDEIFKRHGDLQRHLRVHRLTPKITKERLSF